MPEVSEIISELQNRGFKPRDGAFDKEVRYLHEGNVIALFAWDDPEAPIFERRSDCMAAAYISPDKLTASECIEATLNIWQQNYTGKAVLPNG